MILLKNNYTIINQILNFSELEQHEDNDIERLDLIIKASLIFLEKASLKNIFKKKKSEETEEIISKKKGWFSRRN